MNRRLFTVALAALLLTGVSAFAQSSPSASTWTIDTNHTQVNFAISHLGVSTVRGSISGVTGTVVWDEKNPSNSSVQATINTTTVTTNNEKRGRSPEVSGLLQRREVSDDDLQVDCRNRHTWQTAGCGRPDAGWCNQECDAGC